MRLLRPRTTIQNTWLIRVLAESPYVHQCTSCGARMFVKVSTGLCPICRAHDHRREGELSKLVEDAAAEALEDWS
jgi:rubrerythrin